MFVFGLRVHKKSDLGPNCCAPLPLGIEVVWSSASKTVSREEADLELDAPAEGKPVKGSTPISVRH